MIRALRIAAVATAVCSVGCTSSGEPDFCRDHHLYHADHANEIGILSVELDSDGSLQKSLQLPDGTMLTDPNDELFGLTFRDDGRTRQIDVYAFDQLPELQEIEVTMTTPATSKRFAISRECPNPVFRLD